MSSKRINYLRGCKNNEVCDEVRVAKGLCRGSSCKQRVVDREALDDHTAGGEPSSNVYVEQYHRPGNYHKRSLYIHDALNLFWGEKARF